MNAIIERVRARAATLPTESQPESDGTLRWSSTTMVLAECSASGVTGIGYTYAHACTALLIEDLLGPELRGVDAMATSLAHQRAAIAVRNQGREGIAAAAISALDVALWDLKARLLGVPLATLLGPARNAVPVYASGGFTSSTLSELSAELEAYVSEGVQRVKIKVGRNPEQDGERVRVARESIGRDVALMVDANGAYERKQALRMAERFAQYDVVWFEEPVSSDDLEGLRLLRDRAPAGMCIAAGEYGYHTAYFERMLNAAAVDVLQADATRCAGVSGFMRADALCSAHAVPLSSHCAPALHCHLGAAAANLVHLEYFRDHVRMEGRLFEHAPALTRGVLRFDERRPGLGIGVREKEFVRHAT